jgi:glycosyltransferase involved in cell wall biosynthesis
MAPNEWLLAGTVTPPLRILTNLERFPETWKVSSGETGTARFARSFAEFRALASGSDVLLINGDASLVYRLALYFVLFPWRRKPVVTVDLVLRKPLSAPARAGAALKKLLLTRVDHFINYFRESEGYGRYYGITPERSSFVPFKPNLRYRYDPAFSGAGDYILCFGRSRRDYDTFFRAMEQVPYPGAIPEPDFAGLRRHGSRFTYRLDQIPRHVQVLPDDGSQQRMIQILEGARVVVLPFLSDSLFAGMGVYLNAMLLRKCVIVSEGPAVSDVLTGGEALLIPPEDPAALATMIQRVWQDDGLRGEVAERGYRYALSLGGEPELRARILEKVVAWYKRANAS